jgi:hypothetical protein
MFGVVAIAASVAALTLCRRRRRRREGPLHVRDCHYCKGKSRGGRELIEFGLQGRSSRMQTMGKGGGGDFV